MEISARASEITEIIRQQISDFKWQIDIAEVGTVIQASDGIARVYGLENAVAGELLDFPHGVKGMAFNLDEDDVGVVLFGEYEKICEGDTVKRTGRVTSVPVCDALIGRVVNALGEAVDGGPAIAADTYNPVERIAPGIVARTPVRQPLQTGIKAIDAMTAIGRGQRELIIGDRDRKSGG